ncbi:hypothetical protein BH23PLA1_BH23PLA1_10170 [soil metagenome]
MFRPRASMAGLCGLIAACAVALAGWKALKDPSAAWAGTLSATVPVALLGAAIAAWRWPVPRRHFWGGFALVGGLSFSAMSGPWAHQPDGRSILAERLARRLYDMMHPFSLDILPCPSDDVVIEGPGNLNYTVNLSWQPFPFFSPAAFDRWESPHYQQFRTIASRVGILAAALIGGMLAVALTAIRRRVRRGNSPRRLSIQQLPAGPT